jgi:NADH dehydrogenase FAD-containing subunit
LSVTDRPQIASGPTVTPGSAPALSKYALKALQDLKVDIRLQTKVTSSTQIPRGAQELTLSNGDKLMTDMYIPLFGVIPNSSYVPAKFLDAYGSVVVDEYLKVKGAVDVWAIGDISNVEPARWIYCEKHSKYAAETFASILTGKTPLPYKLSTTRKFPLQLINKTRADFLQLLRGFKLGRSPQLLLLEISGFQVLW